MDVCLVTAGTLYVVATPLGNLGDLSDRAIHVLRAVTVVAAEDTRRARVLLQHADARPRVLSFHAHSPPARIASIVRTLAEGQDVALIADAGTPTVSDPGANLVQRARDAGAAVVAVPGPSAVAAALSVSGLSADRFTFLGFLPRKGADRKRLLEQAAGSPWTTVLFESPNRLVKLLVELGAACGGDRKAVVTRELTKVHEEARAGTLDSLEGYYREHAPRGEVTVVVAGISRSEAAPRVDEAEVSARARELLDEGVTRRDAATELAKEFPIARREAYRIVSNL
ncbi:MAG: 16S rRNA (cytidine(1402)-2'-O)-methyltransferase [Gemmatimonadota bacterium]|nr:16S rRNA (cytidine(1402)-2'-O)-methyltransferase [Gemmatimonadota bacterium]